jgi:hypothetical protein
MGWVLSEGIQRLHRNAQHHPAVAGKPCMATLLPKASRRSCTMARTLQVWQCSIKGNARQVPPTTCVQQRCWPHRLHVKPMRCMGVAHLCCPLLVIGGPGALVAEGLVGSHHLLETLIGLQLQQVE